MVTAGDGARPAAAGRAPSRTAPPAPAGAPLLRLHGIGKNFGPVHALADIDLDIPAGSTVALAILVAATIALWLIATMRHALPVPAQPMRGRDTHEVLDPELAKRP